MDKSDLVEQLAAHLRKSARTAHDASTAAAEHARHGATSREKRTDARIAVEFAGLARGQGARAERAFAELSALARFRPEPLGRGACVQIGAVVEIEDEESAEGRTFFLAPVGAGATLSGPGGDGVLSVVTPASPIGRAVMGRVRGDVVDVKVGGREREWKITWIE